MKIYYGVPLSLLAAITKVSQIFISYHSGGWEVQQQDANRGEAMERYVDM